MSAADDGDVTSATAGSDGGRTSGWTPRALVELRQRPNRRRAALLAAALAGVALGLIHWVGLVTAGALVGLASETVPRAVAAGLVVGLLVLGIHVLASPVVGVGEFLALAPASYVAIGIALIAPAWGALVRAVV